MSKQTWVVWTNLNLSLTTNLELHLTPSGLCYQPSWCYAYYVWFCSFFTVWATTWSNEQNECAPSEDSDQPGHPPNLIRVFALRSVGSWGPKVSFMRTAKTLIRLRGCPGWSESSLDAQPLCWFCHVAAHRLNESCFIPCSRLFQKYLKLWSSHYGRSELVYLI